MTRTVPIDRTRGLVGCRGARAGRREFQYGIVLHLAEFLITLEAGRRRVRADE